MLTRTDSTNSDFQQLVQQLDAYLGALNGEEHTFYNQFNKIDALNYVVVAYDGEVAVGCGAIKPFDETSTEIKRMYVLPTHRGQGIAGEILGELETWSRELGYPATVLETANDMPDAIGLYAKNGYERIPNYGQYVGMPRSVCMKRGDRSEE
jgi:putative acetyltransferase